VCPSIRWQSDFYNKICQLLTSACEFRSDQLRLLPRRPGVGLAA
jgi:hypothetical protein